MVAEPFSRSTSTNNFTIVPYEHSNDGDAENDLSQIRNLFVDGMKINNAPEEYIQKSLRSDLNDTISMRETYFSGRGTFLVLVENEGGEHMLSDSDGGNNATQISKQKIIKGMVGLQDVSFEAGAVNVSNGTSTQGEKPNLCELRRMSVHSSRRRFGYGTKLIQECISHAKRNKFDGIKLYTGAWMEAAISFYVKMGFEDICRLEHKHDDGSTVTIAHLELTF